MIKEGKPEQKLVSKGRAKKYEGRYTVNASFEDFMKIVVTPKEKLNQEEFKLKKI